jgi:hypothetical protein
MDKQSLPLRGKKINLIPIEMAISPKTVKLTKSLNKIMIVGTIFLFLSIISVVSIFVYFKLQSTKITESIEGLKLKIIDLEGSEQKLVITKDRLNKIALVENLPSVKDDIVKFKDVINVVNSAPDSTLAEANIQNSKTEFSVNSKSSDSLSFFLGPLSKLTTFKNLVLLSLGYSSTSGFISDLIINKN